MKNTVCEWIFVKLFNKSIDGNTFFYSHLKNENNLDQNIIKNRERWRTKIGIEKIDRVRSGTEKCLMTKWTSIYENRRKSRWKPQHRIKTQWHQGFLLFNFHPAVRHVLLVIFYPNLFLLWIFSVAVCTFAFVLCNLIYWVWRILIENRRTKCVFMCDFVWVRAPIVTFTY